MQVVALRRLGKRLGFEKIILRQGRMTLQFVGNPDSVYYKSTAFGKAINYMAANPRRCELKEVKGRRLMHVAQIATVGDAVALLRDIDSQTPTSFNA